MTSNLDCPMAFEVVSIAKFLKQTVNIELHCVELQ